ncbi:lysoplasmalogenase [Streptomyces hiroshimensis]|uniref:lysoplasmalogenase n=1 Tax=Streptomyces hiroshimensis TaxID=66424 RepID=UPI001E2E344F|nr:lysoplasmalogenase [Streptomyces hiroshimensis]
MRPLPAVFGGLALAHLGALLAGSAVALVTKPALMPLLAAYVLTRGGPRLLAVALLFGCGGDTLLQVGGDLPFLLGMASFAAGHGCYLVLCSRHGTPGSARTLPPALGYGSAWLVTVVLLWPDLEAGLRVPVALYSLLLVTMALRATRAGALAAAGGALFVVSDTLIATGVADWPQAPAPQFWVMLTYLGAQFLLAEGFLRSAEGAGRTPGPSSDKRERQRTASRASTMPKP